jgi:aminoglycoside phosphotransferase (APT) family kinase protein
MDITTARRVVAATPLLESVERVEYLDKGYSRDRKYVLSEGGGPKYLIRLADIALLDRRKAEFEILRLHHGRGSPCPEPLEFGTTEDGAACYSVVSYIQGESAEEALPGQPERGQFEIGVVAGRELRKLHEVPHPDPDFDWPAHRVAKYRRKGRGCAGAWACLCPPA